MKTSENYPSQENSSVDIFTEIRYYIFFWPWFLLSIFLFSLGAYLYLRYTNTIYQTSATLQVKDASSDPPSFLTEGAGNMFSFDKVKIDNYIAQIGSKPNLARVSDLLDLQTQVYSVGHIRKRLIFGTDIPFKIIFKTEQTYESLSLVLEASKGYLYVDEDPIQFDLSLPLETDDFKIIVNTNKPKYINNYQMSRSNRYMAVERLSKNIGISGSSKTGDNMNLNIQGFNAKRNEAILNTLIEVAHKQQKLDKQEIFALSIGFINNRLGSIKNEIDSLTLQTTGFKSNNFIFSPKAQTESALTSLKNLDQQQFNLTTQKALAKSLKKNLENQADFSLLPSNIGLQSTNVNELVLSYNALVLERKNLLTGATKKNLLVVQISNQLSDLKTNIFSSVDNYLSNIETSLTEYKDFKNRTNSEVSKIPELESTLIGFQRSYQIAEKLYLFLLERREEASISYESTLPNTRVINYAHTDYVPVKPKKQIIAMAAVLLGLVLPFGILYLLKLTDTKIHNRNELVKLIPNIDIMGEVPFIEDIHSTDDSRSILTETFRMIRSNISFKLNSDQSCKVILSTSNIKGEGKTFTAFNIAASYVATGKKVLLLGADLRNPKLHIPMVIKRPIINKGLSNLIANSSIEISSDYLNSFNIFNNNLDVLFSGPIPPNPSELLGSVRFVSLLDKLKDSYDYIVIDSAPLMLVSDSLPLLKLADLVIYTLRADYTEIKIVSYVNSLVKDKKVNNIGVVFNSVKSITKSYYKYGYGYRYSYQNKSNYGYGYGYDQEKS